MASVGSILTGAFRLFKEQPVTVAIWAVIFTAYTVGISALALSGIAFDVEAMRAGTVTPGAAIGLGLALGFVALLFTAIMICGIYRAILRPEDGGFAWLKLGSDEFRMIGLILITVVAAIFLTLVLGLFAFFLIGGSALATGGGFGLGFAVIAVLFLLGIYLYVRLSLIFPLTFVRRQISIDEGWGLSRGRFWTLFLAYLVIWILLFVIQLFVPQAPGQPGFLDSIRALSDPSAVQAMQARQAEAAASVTIVSMLPFLLISSVVQVLTNVVTNSASATAVREFLRDEGEVLDDDIERTAQIFE